MISAMLIPTISPYRARCSPCLHQADQQRKLQTDSQAYAIGQTQQTHNDQLPFRNDSSTISHSLSTLPPSVPGCESTVDILNDSVSPQ